MGRVGAGRVEAAKPEASDDRGTKGWRERVNSQTPMASTTNSKSASTHQIIASLSRAPKKNGSPSV